MAAQAIYAAPAITSFSPASGAVGTLVTINGSSLGSPAAFTIGGVTAIVVSDNGTQLVGLVMPGAVTGKITLTTSGGNASSATNFTITSNNSAPLAQQGGPLVGSGDSGSPSQGKSVAISADGNTAIVGGPQNNDAAISASDNGAVWIYARSGTTWSQQAGPLVGLGGSASNTAAGQGTGVALSADGNTAAVGGENAVYIFTRTGTSWSQQGAPLTGSGAIGTTALSQGASVGLSADGNTMVEGAPGDNSSIGAIWAFTRSGVTWTQFGAKIVGSGNIGTSLLGACIAISADKKTIAAGGNGDNSYLGAVWIFTLSGSTYVQQAKLIGNDEVFAAQQGFSVALSADGNTMLEGGPYNGLDVISENNAPMYYGFGSAWVFARTGGTWAQDFYKPLADYVTTGSNLAPHEGSSVALSADGAKALIGSTTYGPGSTTGAVFVFIRHTGDYWGENDNVIAGTGGSNPEEQGGSAAISADGTTVIEGGSFSNNGEGAVWTFASGAPVAVTLQATSITNTTATVSGIIHDDGYTTTAFFGYSTQPVPANDPNEMGVSPTNATNPVPAGTGSTSFNSVLTGLNPGTTYYYQMGGTQYYSGGGAQSNYNGNILSFKTTGTAPSTDALLTSIKTTPAANLTIVSGTSYVNYTTTVSNATSSIAITAVTQDPTATITVYGNPVASGVASQQIALTVGTTVIYTIVTAQDGTTTKTYAISVTRLPSSDALLSSIKTTPARTLTIVAGPSYKNYTASVTNATKSITVTPTLQDATAMISVNGFAVASGSQSQEIFLQVGANVINTVVTAQDGTTTKTYTITVTRPKSSDALLTSLKLTPTSALTVVAGPGYVNYTAAVANTTSSVTVTPTEQDATATITVNGTAVASGAASAPIALALGNNTITTVVTAQDGTTTKSYIITINRAESNDALLTSIKTTPTSSLTVVTGPSYVNYTTTVAYTTSTITITPTAQDINATIKVNGTAVTSGTASQPIALATGSNAINTVVTAQDGVTTKTYTITVTRPQSNDALLTSIKLTPATPLTVVAGPSYVNYTASVSHTTSSVTVTPTLQDATATIKVNGVIVASGTASGAIALSVGANTINTEVTAQDGVTTKTYTITVTRAPSTDALLTSIKTTPASSLTIVTGPDYVDYTASVHNTTSSVTVTPTAQDATATITVNGITTSSGTASQPIALAVGPNTINTVVTAQDGITTKTYSITITRAITGMNSYYEPISVTKPTDGVTIENDGITVHQAVSPNGDGINDYLAIDGITNYPNNNLKIIDRSGLMVYQTKGYDNSSKMFDGHSSINGKMQLPGTYFYSLDYMAADGEARHKTGYIILKY